MPASSMSLFTKESLISLNRFFPFIRFRDDCRVTSVNHIVFPFLLQIVYSYTFGVLMGYQSVFFFKQIRFSTQQEVFVKGKIDKLSDIFTIEQGNYRIFSP